MALRRPNPSNEQREHEFLRSHLVHLALIVVTAISGLAAIGGGLGVLFHGLGIPREELSGTPFDSFLIPGLLLTVVVGGSMATATTALLRRADEAGRVAIVAGAVMLGWIVVEALMIHDGRPLQVAVAVVSVATILLGLMLERDDHAHRFSE